MGLKAVAALASTALRHRGIAGGYQGRLAREVPGRTLHGAHRVENNGSRVGEDRSQKVPVSLELREPSEASRQAGWEGLRTLG